MAVVDILRDRERGMPRYNQARRQYGLKPAATFEDLSDNKQARPGCLLCALLSAHPPCPLSAGSKEPKLKGMSASQQRRCLIAAQQLGTTAK